MNKILIDTNLLIYSVDADSLYHHRAQNLLLDLSNELFTTSKNISEFLSVITRGKTSVSMVDAIGAVDDFSRFIKIIFPDNQSQIIFRKMLLRYKPSGLLIHDFEIAAIALSNNITHLATFHHSHFALIKELKLIKI